MPRFTNIGSFIFLAIFTPLTFLMLVSQNTVPGDLLYPIKRFFEGGILVASSVHPTTRAMFQSNLADRRFTEVEKVILARQDYSGLPEFVITVAKAQEQIAQVSDEKTKSDLEKELISSINTYQEKLAEVRTQIVYVPQVIREERVAKEKQVLVQEKVTQVSSTSIQSGPTPTSITVQESSVEPTAVVPAELPFESSSSDDLVEAIDEAREELERVKERLEQQEQKIRDDGQKSNKKEEDSKKDKKEKNDDGEKKENKRKDLNPQF